MRRQTIVSASAPAAIGPYSQAVQVGDTVYLSGQLAMDPATMELVGETTEVQIEQVFDNLAAVCAAAGGSFADVVKLNIFLVDLGDFATVNAAMAARFQEPYPARAAIGVASLPRDARVEVEGVMVLGSGAGG